MFTLDRLRMAIVLESRGIEIVLNQDASHNVFQMFTSCINFKQSKWFVKHLDAYSNILANEQIDLDGLVSGRNLERSIRKIDYCIFGKFVAYPTNVKSGTKSLDVSTYEDFVKSKAEIVILNWDVYYFDIYCKSVELINELALNAEQNGLKYELIDENDSRTRLDVW